MDQRQQPDTSSIDFNLVNPAIGSTSPSISSSHRASLAPALHTTRSALYAHQTNSFPAVTSCRNRTASSATSTTTPIAPKYASRRDPQSRSSLSKAARASSHETTTRSRSPTRASSAVTRAAASLLPNLDTWGHCTLKSWGYSTTASRGGGATPRARAVASYCFQVAFTLRRLASQLSARRRLAAAKLCRRSKVSSPEP